jgi:hypothetical protein
VMNADGEWNDARQAVFAPILCAYGVALGDLALFERGVAAARAAFTLLYCPEHPEVRRAYEAQHPHFGPETFGFMMENVAHAGPAGIAEEPLIGPFCIFTWGPGTAIAAAALVRERYGEAFVHERSGWAAGIDGYDAEVTRGAVHITDLLPDAGRARVTIQWSGGRRQPVALVAGRATAAS